MSKLYDHRCCMCHRIDKGIEPPGEGKYLCQKCFKKVKREFEKQNPGQSLRAKEEPEQ